MKQVYIYYLFCLNVEQYFPNTDTSAEYVCMYFKEQIPTTVACTVHCTAKELCQQSRTSKAVQLHS
jgi:hypothetical protein